MTKDLDKELARIAARHHGVFATQHLDDLKATREARAVRVEAGRWLPVHDGAYRMAGAPVTWRSALMAACWAGGPRALASHRSAGALWSLPSGRTDITELTCPRWRRARHDGLVVHESMVIDDEDHAEVDAIPCTSVARTVFDLARTLSPVMLDANIDNAIRRELVTLDQLRSTSTRLATKGRPGGRRFRQVVEARSDVGALPESVPERLLADMLPTRASGAAAPVRDPGPEPSVRRSCRPRLSGLDGGDRVRQRGAPHRHDRPRPRQRPQERDRRPRLCRTHGDIGRPEGPRRTTRRIDPATPIARGLTPTARLRRYDVYCT